MTTSRSSEQLDLYRHSPARMAEAWRAAAETSREQFPDDLDRYRYYEERAEKLEKHNG